MTGMAAPVIPRTDANLTEAARAFRDKTAVAGVGLTLGKFPERTALSLAIEAFKLALDDSGLKRDDIDGLITLSFGSDYDRFLEATGLNVRYAHQGWTHGRFISPTLQFAAMAVGMGMAKAVAIVNGKRGKAFGQPTDIEMWRQGLGPHGESPAYGALRPAFGAAISAQRYFHLYGGSNDDLGPICVAFRKHARMNPIAVRRDPMTLDDYRRSPWIVAPLRLLDCCQINDGGSCIIVTSAERARDCRKTPALISGMQGVHAGPDYHNLALPGLGVAQQNVYNYTPSADDLYSYRMAGITHKDVDALITYDAFSPLVLFALERFGFCGPGEAREFVKNGRIELGGELPVNTSGGLLSEGHLSGWNLLIEAVRQTRGECGERQVKNAEVVQYGCFLGESLIFRRAS
ncbi:MAG TPA: thiolase family protein [Burkholderiales bacterium]|jgi:acetyl-CoA acetyltransferase|nr:thiolase family protein [Burkholderiales bacterium]